LSLIKNKSEKTSMLLNQNYLIFACSNTYIFARDKFTTQSNLDAIPMVQTCSMFSRISMP